MESEELTDENSFRLRNHEVFPLANPTNCSQNETKGAVHGVHSAGNSPLFCLDDHAHGDIFREICQQRT